MGCQRLFSGSVQKWNQASGYAKYWDAWKNTKTEWYALPVSLGIAWIAVRHFMKLREQEAQKASRGHSEDELPIQPTGPYWIHIYTLLPWRAISRAWGWMNNLIVPEALRSPIYRFYSNAFGCKLDEMLEPDLKTYSNLAEFFIESLKGVRPIAGLDRAMLQVKGLSYAVDALLGPSSLSVHSGTSPTPSSKETSFFQIVIYLAPGDYHRFHSPADWSVSQELETNVAESSLPLGAYELSVKKTLISRGERLVVSVSAALWC
ncbi:phosphatidylserine decarboxylase [Batrachochytrium salamandrivorans]|nr:phosphatidylserine decarboxylase [Batrachochytrium salamandrivorans]